MFQNHNSIGQNNTEQNKGRQNNTWIGDSHSKMRQHRPFCSHHKSVFPTQGHPQAPQHKAPQQDSNMHHTLKTGISTPPFFHPLPPFRVPPFSQGTTSHALGKQTPTEPFQKNSMKSNLFGNKPTPSTQGHPPPHRHPNRTQACTTPSQASAPPFLHPSFFPLPPFLKAPLPMLLARRHQHSHFKKV